MNQRQKRQFSDRRKRASVAGLILIHKGVIVGSDRSDRRNGYSTNILDMNMFIYL